MELIFGILGFAGGVLCAAADILLDYKGKKSIKLGKHRFIESGWDDMASWRFSLSVIFAAAGVPLYFLGFTSLAMQIGVVNKSFALLFWIVSMIGATGGTFIHGILCCLPVLYKNLKKQKRTFDEVENTLNALYDTIRIPFYILYVFLVILSSLLTSYAILNNYLLLPVWMIFLTPLSLMIIGILLRLIKREWFHDLPGITMPSIGLAMIGLMAILNTR